MGTLTIGELLGLADKLTSFALGVIFVVAMSRQILVWGWQYRDLKRELAETKRRLAQWEGVAFQAVQGQGGSVEVAKRMLDIIEITASQRDAEP